MKKSNSRNLDDQFSEEMKRLGQCLHNRVHRQLLYLPVYGILFIYSTLYRNSDSKVKNESAMKYGGGVAILSGKACER